MLIDHHLPRRIPQSPVLKDFNSRNRSMHISVDQFQLNQVVEEQVHRPVPRPNHPIREFMHYFFYFFTLQNMYL